MGHSGGHVWAGTVRPGPHAHLHDPGRDLEGDCRCALKAREASFSMKRKRSSSARRSSAEAYNLYLLARQYGLTGKSSETIRREAACDACELQGARLRSIHITAGAWALLAMAQSKPLAMCFRCLHRRRLLRPPMQHLTINPNDRRSAPSDGAPFRGTAAICRSRSRNGDGAPARRRIEVNKEAARVAMRQGRWRMPSPISKKPSRSSTLISTPGRGWSPCIMLGNSEAKKVAAEAAASQAEQVLSPMIRATDP